MLFRQLIFAAVALGVVVGAVIGIGQQFTTVPLILQAEQYEQPTPTSHHVDAHHAAPWTPSNGLERTVFTVIADMGVAIGFALLLLVLMSIAAYARNTPVNAKTGALWGLAAFAVVFIAPAIGLPPEVPGINAAPLTERQLWWLATVVVAAIALALLVFAPGWKKLPAVILAPLPYLYGAPEAAAPPFAGHSPAAIAALTHIHQQFIWATGLTNLALWLLLGIGGGWLLQRRVGPALPTRAQTAAD